jgi:GT2 family glycosyltransferase
MEHLWGEIDLSSHGLSAPLVSVVVTSFNYGRYLRACLDSIAKQSYPHFECIIVDDVSTDDSIDVIEAFLAEQEDDSRFRLVRHEVNQGQAGGFRTGLEESTGQLICYVDADDILFEDFLRVHVDTHLNWSSCAAFTCSEELLFDQEGVVLSGTIGHVRDADDFLGENRRGDDVVVEPDGKFTLVRQPRPPVFLDPFASDSTFWPWTSTSAMMFRRSVLERVIPEDPESFRICADHYICLFCHFVGGSILIPSALGAYRRHGKNGFSSNPVLGSGRSPGPESLHPSQESAKKMIRRALLGDEETWRELLGSSGFDHALAVFPSDEGPGAHEPELGFEDVWEERRHRAFLALRPVFAWLAPGRYQRHQRSRILQSGLFFEGYYASQLEDRALSVGNLADHYIRYGADQGLDPNPFFDTEFYLREHPDVVAEDWNPLFHYLVVGARRLAKTSPHFDAKFFLGLNPATGPADGDPLSRFLLWGAENGKRPLPFVSPEVERRIEQVRARRTQDQDWAKRREEAALEPSGRPAHHGSPS